MNFDMKSLMIFLDVFETHNISKTAENFDMGQPNVTSVLKKMRAHFKDDLFIRMGHQMLPTEFAKQLYPQFKDAVKVLKSIQAFSTEFDPSTSSQTFTLALTDLSHVLILPKLLNHLSTVAPYIKIKTVPFSKNIDRLIDEKEIDLAIGFLANLGEDYYEQVLFNQHYTCVVAANHSSITEDFISKEKYENNKHLDVFPVGTGHSYLTDYLKNLGIERNISIETYSYYGVGNILENSHLVATIPYDLSEIITKNYALKIVKTGFLLPSYSIKQVWSKLLHQNKGHQWLRRTIFELFSTLR